MKFRKKPVVIDAFQMTEARRMDNSDWPNWLNSAWNKGRDQVGSLQRADMTADLPDTLEIVTLEGNHKVSWGDYIIRGVQGELYPCKPEIFVATYEPVGAIDPAEVLPAEEPVPVAWGESYDGGAFFNTVSLTKTKHHTYPLYAHPPQPRETVAEADQFDRADWFWRDLDPDDSGDCPGNALQFHPDLTVSLIHSSYRGPCRWVFRAEVLDPDSNDTEVLHFDKRDEAMAAAQERAAALHALKGEGRN